jgi:hypothetical protein
MFRKLTTWILIAAALGVIAGWIGNATHADAAEAARLAGYFSILSDVFLRLIEMIIAPLVFATVVAGIAGSSAVQRRSRLPVPPGSGFRCASSRPATSRRPSTSSWRGRRRLSQAMTSCSSASSSAAAGARTSR